MKRADWSVLLFSYWIFTQRDDPIEKSLTVLEVIELKKRNFLSFTERDVTSRISRSPLFDPVLNEI
jgi:hypothetical protein